MILWPAVQPASGRPHGLDAPRFVEWSRDPELWIRRRWLGRDALLASVFAVTWDAFLLSGSRHLEGGAGELAVAVAFGVALTYYAATGWVNRTELRVGRGLVTVRHGPLPLLPARSVPTAEITGIRVRRRPFAAGTGFGTARLQVDARTAGGRHVKLVGGLESTAQASFIARELAGYLRVCGAD
jgi:hypothetical protein